MNYLGVIFCDFDCMDKLCLFEGGYIDGYCLQFGGKDLNVYVVVGIWIEYEVIIVEEVWEKL